MANILSKTSNFKFWSWYWNKKDKELSIVLREDWDANTQFAVIYSGKFNYAFLRESAIGPEKLAIYAKEAPTKSQSQMLCEIGWTTIEAFEGEMPDTSKWEELMPSVSVRMDWQVSKEKYGKLLSVKPCGKYPFGSEGDLEGAFIYFAMKYAVDTCKPDALLVDLTCLDYEWGDNLSIRPDPFCYLDSAVAYICKPDQVSALCGEAVSMETLFTSHEKAIFRIEQMLASQKLNSK